MSKMENADDGGHPKWEKCRQNDNVTHRQRNKRGWCCNGYDHCAMREIRIGATITVFIEVVIYCLSQAELKLNISGKWDCIDHYNVNWRGHIYRYMVKWGDLHEQHKCFLGELSPPSPFSISANIPTINYTLDKIQGTHDEQFTSNMVYL